MDSNNQRAKRQEREANALRENLAKRKQQARRRKDEEGGRPEQAHLPAPEMLQSYDDPPCQ